MLHFSCACGFHHLKGPFAPDAVCYSSWTGILQNVLNRAIKPEPLCNHEGNVIANQRNHSDIGSVLEAKNVWSQIVSAEAVTGLEVQVVIACINFHP